jgi:hypothetical protein
MPAKLLLHRFVDVIARRFIFREDDLVIVSLAESQAEGCPIVPVAVAGIWHQYPLRTKLRALAARRWSPTAEELSDVAGKVFLHELFGDTEDAGEAILDLMRDHWEKGWVFEHLTDHDRKRADAIRVYTFATLQRFQEIVPSPPLNLQLLRRSPLMCTLVNPMLLKIPITSLQYFIDIHVHFAFDRIRRSQHPHATELISLIYELLFLQQKTAVTLKALLEHIVKTGAKRAESLLVQSELDAIINADMLFVYEKATIEKTVALVGHILELWLENKKAHKNRVEALRAALPASALQAPYGSLLLAFVSSDALERLNASRSGLLHKMGIADLQPHNYVGAGGEVTVLRELFRFLHDQHAKNTLVILAAFALLTDDLMQRDPPSSIPDHVARIHPTLITAVKEFLADHPEATGTAEPAG